jgi:alkanesulfonate monooxygenase SsuD/methylene tetrahydromethanopterin reductase-like flavin-dependent oxidoreductase (luciferase family)
MTRFGWFLGHEEWQPELLVAQAAATLDRLSGGRFALGVGTGEGINEAPLGRFPRYDERLARMTEALGLLRPLLAGDSVRCPDAAYYPVSSIRLHSPPLTSVPVYLAAAGPRSAATAGRLADGVLTSVKDPEQAGREVVDVARAAARAAGRTPPTVVLSSFVVLVDSEDEASRALRPWRGLRTPGRLFASSPARLRRDADRLGRDWVLSRYRRVAEPHQLLDFCARVRDRLRPDVFAFQVAAVDGAAAVERFGELVQTLRRG